MRIFNKGSPFGTVPYLRRIDKSTKANLAMKKSKHQVEMLEVLRKFGGRPHYEDCIREFGPDVIIWTWYVKEIYHDTQPIKKQAKDRVSLLAMADWAEDHGMTVYRMIDAKIKSFERHPYAVAPIYRTEEVVKVVVWCAAE